jgi:hypothetical protein
MTNSQTPADAIREAHLRAIDMRESIRQRSQELKAEQSLQQAQEGGQGVGTNT